MSQRLLCALVAVGLIGAPMPALCADITVPLVPQPQEAVTSNDIPSLPPSLLDKALAVTVVDARSDASDRIGQGTDDDDQVFAYRAQTPVVDFARTVVNSLAAGGGLHLDDAAPLHLTLRLTGFSIDESNKPVGSMYGGLVKLAYVLEKNGKPLCEGASEGSAHRYGQSGSAGNVAEVLSDATTQAFANVLSDARLQAAWSGGTAASSNSPDSVEAKLERLDALFKAGKISPEEHKRARAEVLKGI